VNDDSVCFRRTQVGYYTIFSVGITIVVIALLLLLHEFNWFGPATLVLLAVCLVLFATLTVDVRPDRVEIRFGPGLVRRTFLLADFVSCRAVRNRWYYGWGIRLIPGGWMYNVSGLDAVEMVRRDGSKYGIGTAAPEELTQAISRNLSQSLLNQRG